MIIDKKALFPSEGGQPAASDAPKSHILSVMVPDAAYLIRGELSQEGFDLVMTLPDGRQHIVHDYFSFQPPPTLLSASGAGLSPLMVKSFLVRPFDGDVLFAGPATASGALVEIGTVTVLVGQVSVRRLDGSEAQLAKGDKLYKGDVIITGAGSFVKAVMLDGTRFQLGQSGEAALDNFEFNEAQNVGRFEASVRVGGFYYKSGKIGELSSSQTTAHTTLKTPTSIIGVRGSELEGSVDASGNTIVVHRSGVLEISDINGENSVVLDQPGNTATVVLDGTPLFTVEPPPEAQQALEASLPPADAASNDEDEEAEAEEEASEEESEEVDASGDEEGETDKEESSEEEAAEEEAAEEEAAEEEAAEEVTAEEEAAEEEAAEEEGQEEDTSVEGSEEDSGEDLATSASDEAVGDDGSQGDVLGSSSDAADDSGLQSSSGDIDILGEISAELNQAGENDTDLEDIEIDIEESDTILESSSQNQSQTDTQTQDDNTLAPDNPPETGDDELVVSGYAPIDVTDSILANDTDPDANQSLTIVGVTGSREGGAEVVDGRLLVTPDAELIVPLAEGETGTETFTYTVASGDLTQTGTLTLTYLGANDAPEIAPYAIEVNQSDQGFTITPEALLAGSSDPDRTDTLSIENVTLSLGNAIGIAVDNDGSLVVDPSAYADLAENERGVIEYEFEVVERDDEGLELSRTSTTASITIIGVNDAPLVAGVESTATEDDAAYVISLLSESVDVDASNMLIIESLTLSSGDASGVTDNGDGTLSIDPGAHQSLAANENSIVNYTFEVVEQNADGIELSRTESTASITIIGANDAVVVEAITSTANEDDAAYLIDLLANSTDLDASDQLSIENLVLVSGDAASITENADGTLLIDPGGFNSLAIGETSVIVYEYDVVERDSQGTELGRASTRATITMTGENDAPFVDAVNLEASEDDATYVVSVEALLAGSSDVDTTNSLSVQNVAYVSGDDAGITIEADGSLSVAPASYGALGTGESLAIEYSFDVVELDSTGNELSRTPSTVTLTVIGVNDAAVIEGIQVAASEDAASFTVTAEDLLASSSDIDTSDGLRVENLSLAEGNDVGLALNDDGSISVDPGRYDALAGGETEVISYTFDVVETDSTGAELGRTQTSVAISIQGQNDAAAVGAVTIVTDEDQANDVIDLLGNSADPDATDGLSVENLTYVAGDDSGVVVNSDGTLSLNPNQYTGLAEGETETIGYTYDVVERDTSGNELSRNTTSASITVAGRNDVAAITVQLEDAQVTQGAPYDTLAGGTIAVADADNNESNVIAQSATYGTVTVTDGRFEYLVDPSLNLASTTTDTITFTTTDGTQSSVDVTIFTQNAPALLNIVANTTDYVLSASASGVTQFGGTLTLQDAEGAVLLAPSLVYGTFAQAAVGPTGTDGVTESTWTYSVDTTSVAVLGLDDGETLTEVISFVTDDARDIDGDNVVLDVESSLDADSIYTRDSDVIEGRQVIEVVIQGQNDAPVIAWSTLVTEQNSFINLAASEGLLTFVSDPDNADGSVTDVLSVSGVEQGSNNTGSGSSPGTQLVGLYGSLVVEADGALTYTPDEAAQAIALENALFVDDEVFTVYVSDGTTVSQASLVVEIRNPPPKLETAPLSYVTVSDDANLVVQFSDLDAFTVQAASRETLEGLPLGLTATLTTDGQVYSGANLSTATISASGLQSTNGDWVLGVTANDGDNEPVTEQFILAIRSPDILTSQFQVYEFFADETELAAAYAPSGFLDVSLWQPEAGDRFVAVTSGSGTVGVALYGADGVTVTLDSPSTIIFPSNNAQDAVTVTGTLSELQVFGAETGDILIANADLIIGSSGTNPFELHIGATLSINSSGDGTQAGFNDAADGTVGETRGAALSFDAIAVLEGGLISVQPDDQPAAPYLAAGALTNQGRILISGYAENGPNQPSLLQVAQGTNQTGTFAQTVTGETKIAAGGELRADNVQNDGVIRLVSSVDDGLDQNVSYDDGFSVARLTVLDSYGGSGLLVSESQHPTATQAYGFQNLQAPNEVDVLNFTLDPGGQIQVDADLDFVNVSQTLDWRQGSIDIGPDADLTIRGGTVVFGSASLVAGYGQLALGASNTSTQTLDTVTLAIDGELNSNQFQGEVSFHGAVTLTTYGTTSQVATLTISSGDEMSLDGDDQLDVNLVNEGELTIQGDANEITQTLVNAAGGEIDLVLDASGYSYSSTTTRTTSVDLQGTLTNQGSMAITTYQAPSTSSTTTASLVISIGQSTSTLAAIENSGDWIILEDFGANEAAFWFGNDALVAIEVNANVTNTGYLQIVDGQAVITGSLVNSGVIEIDAPRITTGEEGSVSVGLANPRGGTLSIGGDLVLSPSSVLSLTVGASASVLEVRGLDVSGQITTDASSNPTQDLGRLELDFFGAVNDAEASPSALKSLGSLHDRWQNQDPLVLSLGNQFQPGSALTDLASNLPQGYELTLVSSATQTNTQTISVEISNGFEFVFDGTQANLPSSADDVLILADLGISGGETLEVKSFSLEGSNATTSATVTLTIFAGGHLITNDQSAIFHGQRLILDADTSAGGHLTLGGDLTVAGEMTLSAASAIDGSGTVNVTPSGTLVIDGGSVDTAIVTEGRLTLSGTALGSSGSLHNLGWTTWSTPTAGVSVVDIDVINDGILQLDPTPGASNSFVLQGVTLAGDGILGLGAVQGHSSTSSFVTEVDINLDNAVLNASEMDLVLFSPLTSTTTVTLSSSGTDPSLLELSDGSAFQSIEVDGLFSSSGASVLHIAGDWRVDLEGMVEFQFDAFSYVLPVLDASQASSLVLQNSSGSTAEFVNQGVLIANGLIVESDVVLANVGDEWGTSSFGQLALSGSSRIDGDFYNLDYAGLSIAGDATFAGAVITDFSSRIQLGSGLTMLDTATYMSASAPSNMDGLVQSTANSASVTFTQDLTLHGELIVYDLEGDSVATLRVGDAAASGELINQGEIIVGLVHPSQVTAGQNAIEINAQVSGMGDWYILGQLTLDAVGTTQHALEGDVFLGRYTTEAGSTGTTTTTTAAASLSAGPGDRLTIGSQGVLITDATAAQTINLVAADSLLVIDGVLDVGDASDGVLNIGGDGTLMLGAQGTLALDANLGSGSGDQITGVTAGNVSPTIHLAGGRLLLNLASSGSALSTVNLLTAPLILGAFAFVDGLVIDEDPINPSVVDVEILTETPSGLDEVNLVPVDPSKVMVGAANLADVFDFAGVGNTTHYLGDSSAFNQSDLILAVGFGHTAYGAVGNDTFELASMDFKRIDGGAGIDTVVLPATGAVDNEGFIHFDFRMTLDGQGFWGMSMDRVEVLDLNDGSSATRHRIHLDADAIAALNDGGNALLDGDSGLVVRGTLGDRVDLYGDFEFVEDTFLVIPELSLDPNSAGATSIEGEVVVKVTQVSHLGQSLLFDESIFVVVHQSNGGKSLFGTDSGETLTGTDFGESIYGREGDDVIDALGGVDQNFGGDGSDSIVFDANDSLVDGGLGIDTLLVTGSIDLSNLNGLGAGAPLANMEIISMAGNESADALNLDMADMLDWVGDNSLDALVGENNYRVFVVRGDADDQLSLDGVDITLLQATQSDIDLFGEGELFTLYRDDALGIDLYVSQAMLATLDAAVVEDPEVMPLTATSILEDFAPIAADASGWS